MAIGAEHSQRRRRHQFQMCIRILAWRDDNDTGPQMLRSYSHGVGMLWVRKDGLASLTGNRRISRLKGSAPKREANK